MYKVLITGDRHATAEVWEKVVRDWITKTQSQHADLCVIHGMGKGKKPGEGIDNIADRISIEMGIDVARYPPDWGRHKMGAGPKRNQKMIDENPDIQLVLAFHHNLTDSRGTKDMVNRAVLGGFRTWNINQYGLLVQQWTQTKLGV